MAVHLRKRLTRFYKPCFTSAMSNHDDLCHYCLTDPAIVTDAASGRSYCGHECWSWEYKAEKRRAKNEPS